MAIVPLQDRLSAARMMTAPFQPLRNLPHASHSIPLFASTSKLCSIALLYCTILLSLPSEYHLSCLGCVRARSCARRKSHSRYQSVHGAIASEQCTICHPSYATLAWRLTLSRCPSQTPWTLSMSDRAAVRGPRFDPRIICHLTSTVFCSISSKEEPLQKHEKALNPISYVHHRMSART